VKDRASAVEAALGEFCSEWTEGAETDADAFCCRHPDLLPELRQRIDEFIFAAEGLRSLGCDSQDAAGSRSESSLEIPTSGRTFGDFRLLREIGRGGMGVVYEAEQVSLGRTVAFKLLASSLSLQFEAVERFRREARAMARIRHPGIAQIYEVGEEGDARFLAMEFVEGCPLHRIIDALREDGLKEPNSRVFREAVSRLAHRTTSVRKTACFPSEDEDRGNDRGNAGRGDEIGTDSEDSRDLHSSLLATCRSYVEAVCRVVLQVAETLDVVHRAGIIHRDVKPSNILLRPDGRAVLTDFGIAFTEDARPVTVTGDFVGSPHYVPPERIRDSRSEADRRMDVYSLGVTLYELLTLRRPFEGRTTREVADQIMTREPTPPIRLNSQIPPDLETICLTAMEKDPNRRYGSAADLVEDLRRFLEYRPVRARPIGRLRRAGRLIRRRPVHATAVLLAFLLVVVAPAAFGFYQSWARGRIEEALQDKETALADKETALSLAQEARETAREQAETAMAISEYIIRVFKEFSPANREGKEISVNEVFRSGLAMIDETLGDQGLIRGHVLDAIGEIHYHLGMFPETIEICRKAVDALIPVQGDDHRDVLSVREKIACALFQLGRLDEAEEQHLRVLEGRRRTLGEHHADTLASMANLAVLYKTRGDPARAEEHSREVLDAYSREFGEEDERTLTVMNNLASLYLEQKRLEDAETLFRKVLEIRQRVLGADDPATLNALDHCGQVCLALKKFDEAESAIRKALEGRMTTLGPDHYATCSSLSSLGVLLDKLGRYGEAEVYFRRAREGCTQILGEEHFATIKHSFNLAMALYKQGRHDEARPLAEEVLSHTPQSHRDYALRSKLVELTKKKPE
jgi:eukaryotic-like serine/threonine-protein kinase